MLIPYAILFETEESIAKPSATSDKSVKTQDELVQELQQDRNIIQNPNKQEVVWDDDVNSIMRANFITNQLSIVEHHRRIYKG